MKIQTGNRLTYVLERIATSFTFGIRTCHSQCQELGTLELKLLFESQITGLFHSKCNSDIVQGTVRLYDIFDGHEPTCTERQKADDPSSDTNSCKRIQFEAASHRPEVSRVSQSDGERRLSSGRKVMTKALRIPA